MTKKDCIFCKLANKELPVELVYETDTIAAFYDLNPQAPLHILIVPKQHYDSLNKVEDITLLGELLSAAKKIAKKEKITDFRIVINTGKEAGQSVFHLHLHLLGKRPMLWPPG